MPPGTGVGLQLSLSVRPLEAADLPELEWTGGDEHLRALTSDIGRALAGEIAQLVVAVPNGRLVAFGAVDFTREPDAGRLWMLSVRPSWQSLGLGTTLIAHLEEAVRAEGRSVATIAVEHDNPRARALYLRRGYRPVGAELDSWRVGPRQTYVTVTEVLRRELG